MKHVPLPLPLPAPMLAFSTLQVHVHLLLACRTQHLLSKHLHTLTPFLHSRTRRLAAAARDCPRTRGGQQAHHRHLAIIAQAPRSTQPDPPDPLGHSIPQELGLTANL
eukprot:scaffold245081_cov15-Tisochrysis_lutea.AAC.1